jgi:uncharacterized integral membrane protein (TIGR00697 family)
MLYLTLDLASNVVGYRETKVGFFLLPGSTFIYPLTYTLADIITEVYKYPIMRQVLWAGIFCDFIFSLSVLMVLHLPKAIGWDHDFSYQVVLGNLLRFNVACAIALFAGGFGNAYIIAKWGKLIQGKYFLLRSLGSSAVGQAVYLSIALTVSFYGIISFHSLINMIVSHYIFNSGESLCSIKILTIPGQNRLANATALLGPRPSSSPALRKP